METDKMSRIQDFLSRHHASTETISDVRLRQFQRVDDAIQARLARLQEAKETTRSNAISIHAIAADTGISAKTFYNNALLGEYVREYEEVSGNRHDIADQLKRLKERYAELERQHRGFLLRDIEVETLRHENTKLQNEIKILQVTNKSLQKDLTRLQANLDHVEQQLSSGRKPILSFNGKPK